MTRPTDKPYRRPASPPDSRTGNLVVGFGLAMALYFLGMLVYDWVAPWLQ